MEAYRAHGHKAAKINPLLPQKPVVDSVPEITMMSDMIKGRLNTSGKCWLWMQTYRKHAAHDGIITMSTPNHVLLLIYMQPYVISVVKCGIKGC